VVGKTGQVYARLFTEDFQPLKVMRFPAVLKRIDGGTSARSR